MTWLVWVWAVLVGFGHWIWQDIRAWRQGLVRVAPRGSTGRVYAERPKRGAGSQQASQSAARASLHMKITRVNGDIEEIEVPAEVSRNGE